MTPSGGGRSPPRPVTPENLLWAQLSACPQDSSAQASLLPQSQMCCPLAWLVAGGTTSRKPPRPVAPGTHIPPPAQRPVPSKRQAFRDVHSLRHTRPALGAPSPEVGPALPSQGDFTWEDGQKGHPWAVPGVCTPLGAGWAMAVVGGGEGWQRPTKHLPL